MYDELIEIVKTGRNIVFLGGAGVSTESGIPDFRSSDGLWQAQTKYGCSPEMIVSHSFFVSRTADFYEFYFDKLIYPDVKPNFTHTALASLERQGKLSAVVTQNIDGLHQAAGSEQVYELHGSVWRNYCMECRKMFDLPYITAPEHWDGGTKIPRCDDCGGIVKPDVVLFEEPLDEAIMNGAIQAIKAADTLIVGGTSLAVYPAAGLVNYFKGNRIVLINLVATPLDRCADLVIKEPLGKVFESIFQHI